MKLEITKKDLDSCISTNAITIGSGTDVFCNYIFRVGADFLQVITSNGRAGILSSIVLPQDEDREEITFGVEAWRMKAWSDASSSDTVTLTYDNKSLTLKDDLGSVQFPCSSIELFPFWDSTFESVKNKKHRVSSDFLKKAFTFVKGFVADSAESERPEIAVAESEDGVLAATNALVLASVSSPIFKDICVRVHGKDFSTLMKFLSSCKGGPVEVYPSSKGLFIEREDGTIFSLARPSVPMKRLTVSDERDLFITVDKNTLKLAMKSLSSAMSRDDDKMLFEIDSDNVILSDGTDKNTMSIPCSIETSNKPFPEKGFWFTYPYFQNILGLISQDEVKIEILFYEKDGQLQGGMLCLREEDDDAQYSADLVFRA